MKLRLIMFLAFVCLMQASFAQSRQLTGKVTGDKNTPLISATILVKGAYFIDTLTNRRLNIFADRIIDATELGDGLASAGGFQKFVNDAINWSDVMPYVNYVNLMTYDLVSGYATTTGHHSPLFESCQVNHQGIQIYRTMKLIL